jgi:hypothetical protein
MALSKGIPGQANFYLDFNAKPAEESALGELSVVWPLVREYNIKKSNNKKEYPR